jgi:hypothetical protein
MNRKGTTAEEVKTIIILIIFLGMAFLIISTVFHFSLFGLGGGIPRLTSAPAVCALTYINYSIPGKCLYTVTASSGSPGLGYNVFNNISGRLGSYVAGESAYTSNFTLSKGSVLFMCNTTGANSSVGGYYYTAGGASSVALPCG